MPKALVRRVCPRCHTFCYASELPEGAVACIYCLHDIIEHEIYRVKQEQERVRVGI